MWCFSLCTTITLLFFLFLNTVSIFVCQMQLYSSFSHRRGCQQRFIPSCTFEFLITSNGHSLPFCHSQTLLSSLSVNGLESYLLATHLFPCQHCSSRLHFLPGLPFSLCSISFFFLTKMFLN